MFSENDDLNEAMIAEETQRTHENRRLPEKESVMVEALRIQQKINEERKEENRELKATNKELERRLRELEDENLRLRMRLEMREERETAARNSYERVVDRLLEAVIRARDGGERDHHLDEQIKVHLAH